VSERATPEQPTSLPRGTVLRHTVSFILGWALVIYEVRFRSELRESVLVFAAVALGLPGVAVGAPSLVDAFRSRAGTGSPSEPPPPSVSSPP
jgi:hypothetical protein